MKPNTWPIPILWLHSIPPFWMHRWHYESIRHYESIHTEAWECNLDANIVNKPHHAKVLFLHNSQHEHHKIQTPWYHPPSYIAFDEQLGSGSCIFNSACYIMNGPSTGGRTMVGDNSCIGSRACYNYQGTSVGDNACVGNSICRDCMVDVPAGECNVEENTVTTCANCPCAC